MKDEDYAFETQRQKRLDEKSPELEALYILRDEVVKMSYHNDICFRHGFLCTAISKASGLTQYQEEFLLAKVIVLLDDSSVIDIEIEGDYQIRYLNCDEMFAAMNHAYRLGIIDQWIKEKENGKH